MGCSFKIKGKGKGESLIEGRVMSTLLNKVLLARERSGGKGEGGAGGKGLLLLRGGGKRSLVSFLRRVAEYGWRVKEGGSERVSLKRTSFIKWRIGESKAGMRILLVLGKRGTISSGARSAVPPVPR